MKLARNLLIAVGIISALVFLYTDSNAALGTMVIILASIVLLDSILLRDGDKS